MTTESEAKNISAQDDAELNASQYIERLRGIFDKYTSTRFFAMLNACVNCGACAEACHYYCSEKNPDHIPANRTKQLARIIAEYFHPLKSKLGFIKPGDPMTNPKFDRLYKAAFEDCTPLKP